MRSRCSSAAIRFSMPFSSTVCQGTHITMIGRGGQISSNVLVGVFSVQIIRRSRCRGDPKTTCLHFRHTCDSVFHLRAQGHRERKVSMGATFVSTLQQSNISRRAVSGSMLIVTCSTLERSVIGADIADIQTLGFFLRRALFRGTYRMVCHQQALRRVTTQSRRSTAVKYSNIP